MKSDLVDIDVEIHFETEKAWKVSVPGQSPVWVPKSQCEMEQTTQTVGVLTMPERWAVDKGLV